MIPLPRKQVGSNLYGVTDRDIHRVDLQSGRVFNSLRLPFRITDISIDLEDPDTVYLLLDRFHVYKMRNHGDSASVEYLFTLPLDSDSLHYMRFGALLTSNLEVFDLEGKMIHDRLAFSSPKFATYDGLIFTRSSMVISARTGETLIPSWPGLSIGSLDPLERYILALDGRIYGIEGDSIEELGSVPIQLFNDGLYLNRIFWTQDRLLHFEDQLGFDAYLLPDGEYLGNYAFDRMDEDSSVSDHFMIGVSPFVQEDASIHLLTTLANEFKVLTLNLESGEIRHGIGDDFILLRLRNMDLSFFGLSIPYPNSMRWSFQMGWIHVHAVSHQEAYIFSPRLGWLGMHSDVLPYFYWYDKKAWLHSESLVSAYSFNEYSRDFIGAGFWELNTGTQVRLDQGWAPETLGNLTVVLHPDDGPPEKVRLSRHGFEILVEANRLAFGTYTYERQNENKSTLCLSGHISLPDIPQSLRKTSTLSLEFEHYNSGHAILTIDVEILTDEEIWVFLESFTTEGPFTLERSP